MSWIHPRLWIVAVACALTTGAAAAARHTAAQNPQPPREPIRVGVDLVTTPVTVRDRRGQFLADLKYHEFELYEDGVSRSSRSHSRTEDASSTWRGLRPRCSRAWCFPRHVRPTTPPDAFS